MLEWFWFAIPLAFIVGFLINGWVTRYYRSNKGAQVSQNYFQGLNFLLNEEPDKAIEAFIKALEVDSETVELHLALGGLFRRKGEVDRAIRIHQNLIARPDLTVEHRLQSIEELAQDYYKAGLLDRAENLFLELKESGEYQQRAIEGLLKIYQQEKDWKRAIQTIKQLKRSDRQHQPVRSSHYWCELAEIAITETEYDEARRYLQNALNENRSSSRAVLLQGELSFKRKQYAQATALWQSLAINHSDLSELVIDKMIYCYQQLKDEVGLRAYLQSSVAMPKTQEGFKVWQSAFKKTLGDELGDKESRQVIYEHLAKGELSHVVAEHLAEQIENKEINSEQQESLIKLFLNQAKDQKFEYTCSGCGFDTRARYWNCPNCKEWDSCIAS